MDLRHVPVLSGRSAVPIALALLSGRALAQDSYLLGPAPAGGEVRQFDVSPDGHWAAYVDGFVRSVRVTGAEKEHLLDPRPVEDPLVFGQPLFRISPDSRRVVYGVFDGSARLASVPIDGSAPAIDLHEGLGEWAIAPDSSRVVLRTGSRSFDGDLVSLAIDGTGPAVVILANSRIGGFVVTPDSKRVVYTVSNAFGGGLLWVAPLDGSAPPLQLNSIATRADPSGSYLLLIPRGGDRLVYRRGTQQTVGDLFSVPLDGSSSPIQLNAPGFYNLEWRPSKKPRFTSDGRSIAYTEIPDFPPREHRLFVAPVDGSSPAVALSTSLGTDGVFEWEFVDSGADVLFVHANGYDAQLYRCPSDGSEAPHSLSAPVAEPWYFKVPPGGTRAVFTARHSPSAPFELWSVPIDGSEAPLRLSDSPGIDGGVMNQRDSFGFAQAGKLVLYATDREGDFNFGEPSDVFRLWAVPIDGSAPPARIDGVTSRGGSVRFTTPTFALGSDSGVLFHVAANGKRLLYLADQRLDATVELFATSLQGVPSSPRWAGRK